MFTTNPDWTTLVERIRSDSSDSVAVAELYRSLSGLRWLLCRQIGVEADDAFHDLMAELIDQIRRGCIQEPERLAGYVRTMASRRIALCINARVRGRQHDSNSSAAANLREPALDPEARAIRKEQIQIASRILHAMPARDREVLVRFYLDGEPAEAIQEDMGLTDTKFRLLKSRAKARFSALCQRQVERPGSVERPPLAKCIVLDGVS